MREYKIVLLGPRGAGKTVYLGSLFHKLSTPGHVGYYLKAPLDEQKKLNKIFSGLITEWPKGTAMDVVDQWHLDVMVPSRSNGISDYKAARMVYYDYAGGRLTDSQASESEEDTQEIIHGADVLLGLLDGKALFKEISQGVPDLRFWYEDVKGLCDIMMEAQNKSIHFVVSKWDLFRDSDESIRQIRSRLEAFEPFKNLVDSRARGAGITRLIPVSSVGAGFATLQPDGQMVRRENIMPNPLYVETPFACILPDLIQAEMQQLITKAQARAETLARPVIAKLSFWERISNTFNNYLKPVSDGLGLDATVLNWLTGRAAQNARLKVTEADEVNRQNRAEAERLQKNVSDEHSATIFVLNSMGNAVTELERAYPSSKIFIG